ncbi:MAG: efflux RND transporter periplasmic adaptor subunit [Planctomycetes bacterium]|nr:efflux RND transporter periplasmic adaptor subunit [Planctomycetota bacterium]
MAFWKILGLVCLLLAAGFGGYWFGATSERLHKFDENEVRHPHPESNDHQLTGVVVDNKQAGHLTLSPEVIKSLNVQVAAARRAPQTEPLVLAGSLFLDSSHLAVVHTRFTGEVVRVGEVPDSHPANNSGSDAVRQVRAGDAVKKNDILAVIWSKEIGEKKSDLVESLSRRNSSKATLERLEGLEKGSVSGQVVRDARRQYESDLIAVERAERTLRSWKETEAEIAEVYAEAERIVRGESPKDSRVRETWANVEIRAPLDGVVLERNISLGEIVETGFDMFKIADVSRMGVLANVYEEDISKLTSLPEEQRKWKVRLKAEPESEAISGVFEVIGHVIDPGQHTAAVVGWITNPNQRFRTGQFITATIELPGPSDAILIPNAAVIDQGASATVFVATDSASQDVTARQVSVLRRGRDFALIRQSPVPNESPFDSLREGELVITSGNLELFGVLQDNPPTTAAK